MSGFTPVFLVAAASVAALGFLWWLIRHVGRRNRVVDEDAAPWPFTDTKCPRCGQAMEPGYVMLGRGAIWASRDGRSAGTFAHIGQSLPNTLSLDIRPALNRAWRCVSCQQLLIDHSRLIRRSLRRTPRLVAR